MDVKAEVTKIFDAHHIREINISSRPMIIDELVDLIDRIVDAHGEAVAENYERNTVPWQPAGLPQGVYLEGYDL